MIAPWIVVLIADAAAIAGFFLLGPRFFDLFERIDRWWFQRRLRRGRGGYLR